MDFKLLFITLSVLFSGNLHATITPIILDNGVTVQYENDTTLAAHGVLSAHGIKVGDNYYDVFFEDGTCNDVFDGCNETAFQFTVESEASAAALALRDQVFLNAGSALFNRDPTAINGCTHRSICDILTPLAATTLGGYYYVQGPMVIIYSGFAPGYEGTRALYTAGREYTHLNYARWAPTPVPLPATLPLFALALTGLVLRKRYVPSRQ